MKKITLIRHAKSSWDDPQLHDIDRPLNKRGETDAQVMAKVLFEKRIIPDHIICSPARRTQDTCAYFMEYMDLPTNIRVIDRNIYFKSVQAMIESIRKIDNAHKHAFMFGHQPFLADLYDQLTGENILHVPTTGICHIEFDTKKWENIAPNTGKGIFVIYPKLYKI